MRNDNIVKEYVKSISDSSLDDLFLKLQRKIGVDVADAADILSQDKDVDKWLASASSADEWFEMMDRVHDIIKKEVYSRNKSK